LPLPVIPSEEGIQATLSAQSLFWIPIFMGMTHGKKQPSAVSDQPCILISDFYFIVYFFGSEATSIKSLRFLTLNFL